MVEGLKELLIAGQAPGIIHHHRLTHGQRQKQHGHDGGHHAGPAQADVIGIGLVAGGKAAAGVGGEQDRAYGEGCEEWGLGNSALFHGFFLLQTEMLDGLAGKQKILSSLLPFGRRDERMKNLPRYHSSLFPLWEHPLWDTIISLHCNGSTRLHLLTFGPAADTASSAIPSTLCLAPTGTSLKARPCLLLCVIAFL